MVTGSWPGLATVSPRITSLVSDTVPSEPTTWRWLTTVDREYEEVEEVAASSRGFLRMPRREESRNESRACCSCRCTRSRRGGEPELGAAAGAVLLVVVLEVLLLILRARRPPNRGRPEESVMSAVRGRDAAVDVELERVVEVVVCLVDSTAESVSGSVRFVLVRRSALSPNSGRPRSSVGPTP